MIMESFVAMQQLSFRTKCLNIERAAAFARALNANRRFTEVEIRESKRAKGEARWFVCFLPANPLRQAAMVDRQQSARAERAATESFTVVADPDHDYLHVYSHGSQETYEVSLAGTSCSCPDFHYRGSANLVCKHLLAAASAVGPGPRPLRRAVRRYAYGLAPMSRPSPEEVEDFLRETYVMAWDYEMERGEIEMPEYTDRQKKQLEFMRRLEMRETLSSPYTFEVTCHTCGEHKGPYHAACSVISFLSQHVGCNTWIDNFGQSNPLTWKGKR
jgi:hypothetical protein